MNISKQKSHVKSRVSHYTKITLLGVIIILIGVSGIILFIRTLGLLQVSLLALLIIAGWLYVNMDGLNVGYGVKVLRVRR